MARNQSRMLSASAWVAACCGCLLLASTTPAQNIFQKIFGGGTQNKPAEAAPVRPSQVRDLKRAGDDAQKKGDYEQAHQFYTQAMGNQADLTPTEQKDLMARVEQNITALNKQSEGRGILRRAEEIYKEGRPEEASALLGEIQTNQYLSQSDIQARDALVARLRSTSSTTVRSGPRAPIPQGDARSLLSAGRAALSKNDFELAENLAKQAEVKWSGITMPWQDNPSRLLKDVQAQRAKVGSTPTPAPMVPGVPVHRPDQQVVPANDTKPVQKSATDSGAKTLVNGIPATSLPKPIGPKESAMLTSNQKNATGPAVPPVDAVQKKNLAVQMVRDGYRALQAGEFDKAKMFAIQAKELNVPFEAWEQSPEKLLNDAQKMSGKAPAGGASNADPKFMIQQARVLVEKGQYDEAEKLVAQASTARPSGWGLFEDSPDKVRADILRMRGKRDRDESANVLAAARKEFQRGNLDVAKKLAFKAQSMHGPYSFWETGDRPDKLLEEIGRLEVAKQDRTPGSTPSAGPPGSTFPPVPPQGVNQLVRQTPELPNQPPMPPQPPGSQQLGAQISGTADLANRQRAFALMGEARQFQMSGKLIEARRKLVEADAVGAQFSSFEENPKSAMAVLNTACNMQLTQTMQQVTLLMSNPNDPDRFKKAELTIAMAQQLAGEFQMDRSAIDMTAHQLKQVQAMHDKGPGPLASNLPPMPPGLSPGAPTPPPGFPTPPPGAVGPGLEKLEKARLEIRNGRLDIARKLAEEATAPMYQVREQALAVLRTIDAEDNYARANAAKRNADAGIDRFVAKDYGRALAILKDLDIAVLNPDQQGRIKQILQSPEMQPEHLARTSGMKFTDPDQKIRTIAANANDLAQAQDNLTETVRAMEQIKAQKLRDQGLAVQRKAMESFNAGDNAQAVRLLQEYLAYLDNENLDSQKLSALKRPVEMRMQQYKTAMAQRQLQKEQQSALGGQHNEAARNKGIAKRENDIAELMKQYRTLYKEGKIREAKAKAEQALELDPDNSIAAAAVNICTIRANEEEIRKSKAINEQRFVTELSPDQGPNVNMDQPVAINKDIFNRARNRDSGKGFSYNSQNPVERAIERKLNEPTSLNFRDTPLSQVLSDLQTMTGINIVADKPALRDRGISMDTLMTVKVENISLKSAMNILLSELRLAYTIADESLKITTPDQTKGRMKMVTYPVADLVVPVENHATPSINNLHDALMRHIQSTSGINNQGPVPAAPPWSMNGGAPVSSQGSGGGWGPQASGGPNASQNGGWGVSKSQGRTIEDLLINLITGTIAQDSWASVGGKGTIQFFPLGMALVVNQAQEVQEEVQALLATLRKLQELEVAIEMKMISVSEAFFERIGMDWDFNIQTPKSRYEQQLLTNNFQPFGFVNRFSPDGFVSGVTPAGTFTPDLNVPIKSSSLDFATPPFGGYPGTLGQSGGLALGLAFLSDIQVFMFMEAAQVDRRTNVMQAPKITVFNGQTANISVQDQQFFLTGVTINAAGSQLFFQPNNQPFPLGVNLQVTPVVSADRRFVRLNLTPQLTNLASATVPLIPVQIPVPNLFDGPGPNTTTGQQVIFQMFFQQPTFTQIFLNTTVNVPDGGTVLLGGLKTLSEGRNEAGPPILSKIPYVSRLFRNVGYGREAQSLMIMVTPRIIINEEEEQIYTGQLPAIPRP